MRPLPYILLPSLALFQLIRGHGEQMDMPAAPSYSSQSCRCPQPFQCKPLTTRWPAEVLGFIRPLNFTRHRDIWSRLPWHKLTSLVVTRLDQTLLPDMVCAGHARNTRVALRVGGPTPDELVWVWVNRTLALVEAFRLDGVSLRIEEVPKGFVLQELLDQFASIARRALPWLHVVVEILPNRHLTCQPGKSVCLNLTRVAQSADIIHLDTSMGAPPAPVPGNHSWCRAVGGADLKQTEAWLDRLLATSGVVPVRNVTLGVSWLGYDTACRERRADVCLLESCDARTTDSALSTPSYAATLGILKAAASGLTPVSPVVPLSAVERGALVSTRVARYYYTNPQTSRWHLIWLNTVPGLTAAYRLAREKGLRGVGIVQVDSLDYSSRSAGEMLMGRLWEEVPFGKMDHQGAGGVGFGLVAFTILLLFVIL